MSTKLSKIYQQRKFHENRNSNHKAKVINSLKEGDEKGKEHSDKLKILKDFDLNSDFGPCMGITRMERWERASKFGLNPPIQVREILEKERDQNLRESLWFKYREEFFYCHPNSIKYERDGSLAT